MAAIKAVCSCISICNALPYAADLMPHQHIPRHYSASAKHFLVVEVTRGSSISGNLANLSRKPASELVSN